KDHFKIVINSKDDISSSGDDSLYNENIKYVEASPHNFELVCLEFPPINRSDFTDEEFGDELTHIISPPEYDRFYFRNLPDPSELISILNSRIRKNLSITRVNLPVKDDYSPLLTYVLWIFLAYLTMGDEHLDTIPEKESDEFIKSYVETLVPNPSEFEDESKCDVPNCDDSQTTNFSTFSNPLFDDSTSSDDESSHEEVIHEKSFKTYLNPLFDLDEEITSSEFNPIHNEDLDSTSKNDHFDTKSYLLESLLNHDESIPLGIDCDNSDSEGDTLSLERLLHDDLIPLLDTRDFDFSNVVRVFLPFFTYLVTSVILLSFGSEDIIFDPGISNYHSLEPGVSHRSGTFMKFNESPMEILSSTCSPMDQ
nr:hypothetical protein [Tanacetum cinerariifolium]